MAEANHGAATAAPAPKRQEPRPLAQCEAVLKERKRLRNRAVVASGVGGGAGAFAGLALAAVLFPQPRHAYTLHVPSTAPAEVGEAPARARYHRALGGVWRLPGGRGLYLRRPAVLVAAGVLAGFVLGARAGVTQEDLAWLRDNPDPSPRELAAAESQAAANRAFTVVGSRVPSTTPPPSEDALAATAPQEAPPSSSDPAGSER